KDYFKNFYFIEGGEAFNKTSILKNQNLLFMMGEKTDHSEIKPVITSAKESGVNVETFTMEGIGHDIPVKYYYILNEWLINNKK
ncbi:MAG: hypothetical protein KAG37_07490, partial [Flavobacteriales bacterium]|nr:hypothetical protein [Flavobacteriales bacterium]